MNERKYNIIMLTVILASSGAVLVALLNRAFLLSAMIALSAVLALFIISKQAKDIITEDERLKLLGMKASRISYVIFNTVAAVAGNALILAGKNGPGQLTVIGFTLAVSVCVMLAIDVIAYFWLNKVG